MSKTNKGISTIIATVIMIALVIGLTSILWGVINNLVKERISSSESCFGNFGKVTLDKEYTCHGLNEIKFAINIGEIDVDSVLASVSGPSGAKSFELKSGATYSYVKMFNGDYGGILQLPEKNAGLTYVVSLTGIGIANATSIKIAPIIGGTQCEVSDSAMGIGRC